MGACVCLCSCVCVRLCKSVCSVCGCARESARTHTCVRACSGVGGLFAGENSANGGCSRVRACVCGVQPAALAALAGMTVLTAAGLLRLNVRDVGVTETVKLIFRAKVAPVEHVPGKW